MLEMGSLSDGARHLLRVDVMVIFLPSRATSDRFYSFGRLSTLFPPLPASLSVRMSTQSQLSGYSYYSVTTNQCKYGHKTRKMENRETLPNTVPEEMLLLAEGVGFVGCELGGAGAGTTKATSLRASDQYSTWDRPLNPLPPWLLSNTATRQEKFTVHVFLHLVIMNQSILSQING